MVHTSGRGDALLSPSVTRRVVEAARPNRSLRAALATREQGTLELIARGLSNREIGAALVVEESSIRTHVKRVPMRLGLRDRGQAVIFAYGNGIDRPRR